MPSPRIKYLLPAIGLLLLLTGCSRFGQDMVVGYLYTNTTVPYSIDLNNTPVSADRGENKIVRIREPFTDFGIYTEINSNAIGDIARKHGIGKIYLADMKTFSLFSIWRTQTLVIYGEKMKPEVAVTD